MKEHVLLKEIDEGTNTVEDFIEECLIRDIDYEIFFEFEDTIKELMELNIQKS